MVEKICQDLSNGQRLATLLKNKMNLNNIKYIKKKSKQIKDLKWVPTGVGKI
jgi:hypothetical protein